MVIYVQVTATGGHKKFIVTEKGAFTKKFTFSSLVRFSTRVDKQNCSDLKILMSAVVKATTTPTPKRQSSRLAAGAAAVASQSPPTQLNCCEECNISFSFKHELVAHNKSEHEKPSDDEDKSFDCVTCDLRFNCSSALTTHERTQKHKKKLVTPGDEWDCKLCNITFNSELFFKKHNKSQAHSDNMPVLLCLSSTPCGYNTKDSALQRLHTSKCPNSKRDAASGSGSASTPKSSSSVPSHLSQPAAQNAQASSEEVIQRTFRPLVNSVIFMCRGNSFAWRLLFSICKKLRLSL